MTRSCVCSLGAVAAALVFASASPAQCGSASAGDVAMGMVPSGPQTDLVDTAVAAGNFKTLASALAAADLVATLKGPGPFTVFAPTDEAFAKLPPETLASLLKPENKAKLAAILTYHVVPGAADASTVLSRTGWTTVNGQRIDVSQKDGTAMVDGAVITATDIRASNGVIHVIDAVIVPSNATLVEAAKEAKFNTLAKLIETAGLTEVLSGDQAFTVFAPTDEAFAKLPPETVASLLRPENKAQLAKILTFHVIPGRVYSDDAIAAGTAKTVQGGPLTIAAKGDTATVNGAKILKTDIDARNGVIHVIDTVILPD